MFCEGCGTQIQSGLNYCSRCGRRVAEDTQASKANPLVIAAYVAGVGFVSFIFILRILTKDGAAPNLFVPITFFYFAALFGICFMIMRYGTAGLREKASTDETSEPAYLRPVTTAQLREGFDTPASVTDNTTRALDEVRLRKS